MAQPEGLTMKDALQVIWRSIPFAMCVGIAFGMIAYAIMRASQPPPVAPPLASDELESLGERASVSCSTLCRAATNAHHGDAELFSEWRVDFRETTPGRWRPVCNCGWVPAP